MLPFQTNPRGVEATDGAPITENNPGFRRTLVGLKPDGGKPDGQKDSVSDEPSWG